MADLRIGYPITEPYATGMLKVGQGHEIYYERVGNPKGLTIVFLHGGPGGASWPFLRQYFNPEIWNMTFFDQRGCGQSKPFASIENNTTPHLIKDIEKLRNHLKIKKWAVSGYSWGAGLALAYVTKHSEAVTGVMIGGIWLGRDSEVRDYLLPDGVAARNFPDAYEQFLSPLTPAERKSPFEAYINIFHHPKKSDAARRYEAIKQFNIWEITISMMNTLSDDAIKELDDDIDNGHALSIALLETHYIRQKCFLNTEKIFKDLKKLGHIPAYLVNGRVDAVCPPQTAYDVHKSWPNSQLEFVPFSGHRTRAPAMIDALVRNSDRLALQIRVRN